MAGYNKDIYRTLKKQNDRRDLMGGIAGLISGATQGYRQEKAMQSGDALGQQLGLPAGAGRVIPPGLIAQAMLNKQIADQAQKARRDDLEYELKQRRDMADAENKAQQARFVQETGTREDMFDRELDYKRDALDAERKRYQEWNASREGMAREGEMWDTVRGFGSGVKDVLVAGMKQRAPSADDPMVTLPPEIASRIGVQQLPWSKLPADFQNRLAGGGNTTSTGLRSTDIINADRMHLQTEQELAAQLDAMDTQMWGPTITPEMAAKNPKYVPYIGQRLTSVQRENDGGWFGLSRMESEFPERAKQGTQERAAFEQRRAALEAELNKVRQQRLALRGQMRSFVGQDGSVPMTEDEQADSLMNEWFGDG